MRYGRVRAPVCALIMAVALGGCGGGSSGGGSDEPDSDSGTGTDTGTGTNIGTDIGSGEPSGSSRRLSRVEKDFDLNGTPEMISTISYSNNGRSVLAESTYTDDGTPDEFRLGDETITYIKNQIEFSEGGLPLSASIENTHEDGSNSLVSWAYAYNNGQIESITQETVNPDSSITLTLVPTYTDGMITALNYDTGMITGGWSFAYDDDGALETVGYAVAGTDIHSTTFSWRADGELEAIEKTDISSGAVSLLNTVYDGEGVLQSAAHVDGGNPGFEDSNYTETFTYNGDGTISRITFDPLSAGTDQASERSSWEDGDCYQLYLPQLGDIMVPNMAAGSNAMFPAGVFTRISWCQP